MAKENAYKQCKRCHVTPKVGKDYIKCPKCGLKVIRNPKAERTLQEIWNSINTLAKSEIIRFDQVPKGDLGPAAGVTREVDLHGVLGIDKRNSVDGYSFRNSDEW